MQSSGSRSSFAFDAAFVIVLSAVAVGVRTAAAEDISARIKSALGVLTATPATAQLFVSKLTSLTPRKSLSGAGPASLSK